jgi:putative DNA primase/helicase
MDMICARSKRTVGVTPAVLFRTIERAKPTLIIDEAEVLGTRDERAVALREVLNAGYRAGQVVSRCDERIGHEPKDYKTYCPKVIVLIGDLNETLADRCIEIRMERKAGERIERFRFARVKSESETLKQSIEAWAQAQHPAISDWYQHNELLFLEDREEELWLPLFAVCAVLAPDRLDELQNVALALSGAKGGSESNEWGIRLLAHIRIIFTTSGTDRITSETLQGTLRQLPENPWDAWNHGNGIYPRDIAKLLKPFSIYSQNIRLDETKVAKGYMRTSFEDAWKRYLPQEHQNAATPLQGT